MALTVTKDWMKQEFPLYQRVLYLEVAGDKLRFKDNSHAYNALVTKIQGAVLAQCAAMGAARTDIVRVLHKYVSGDSVLTNVRAGAVRKDFDIDSWASLADLVIYELKSEINYLTEIDLAEMVAMSPRVLQSVTAAIKVLSTCLEIPQVLRLKITDADIDALSRGGHQTESTRAMAFKSAWGAVDDSYTESDFDVKHKHYRAFVGGLGQHSLSDLATDGWIDDMEWDFEKKAAVLHDLLQVVHDFFASQGVKAIFPQHPLQKSVNTLTGLEAGCISVKKVMEPRSGAVDGRSKAFAKSRGRPSESGPSYTTVRVCSINNAVTSFAQVNKHFEGILEKLKGTKSALEYQSAKAHITRIRGVMRQLTDVERKDLVWAMFGYWTLYYRKSVGTAHTFFEIREAAKQCQVLLTHHDRYPTLDKMVTKMGLESYVPTLATRLRKRALKLGLELPGVKNDADLSDRTRAAFAPGGGALSVKQLLDAAKARDEQWDLLRAQLSMAGVSVRRGVPNPFEP